MAVHVLHENANWFPPFDRSFRAAGPEVDKWLLIEGRIDLDATPRSTGAERFGRAR